ncbi:hypothetical protein I552_2627 [Mycobacterium xenopi 3993]|nr:hypothetical protein I552_2627 [Mycobacterium xenopi 3993]
MRRRCGRARTRRPAPTVPGVTEAPRGGGRQRGPECGFLGPHRTHGYLYPSQAGAERGNGRADIDSRTTGTGPSPRPRSPRRPATTPSATRPQPRRRQPDARTGQQC